MESDDSCMFRVGDAATNFIESAGASWDNIYRTLPYYASYRSPEDETFFKRAAACKLLITNKSRAQRTIIAMFRTRSKGNGAGL